jgi:hypothetical protein
VLGAMAKRDLGALLATGLSAEVLLDEAVELILDAEAAVNSSC